MLCKGTSVQTLFIKQEGILYAHASIEAVEVPQRYFHLSICVMFVVASQLISVL